MATGSPFGEEVRKKALHAYFMKHSGVTAETAWEHVYHLLLSMDRRTRLAHVYDSNHMQPGGSFHSRAVRFTDLLCDAWKVPKPQLPKHLDVMFQACVEEYLGHRAKAVAKAAKKALHAAASDADDEEVTEEASEFLVDVTEILASRLGLAKHPDLPAVVAEIEKKAEHYFTIEKKRQNVRGEGFEDALEWLLLNVAKLPRGEVRVRTAANQLPGFRKELQSAGKAKDKVPKPDIALTSPDGKLTLWIITAKWSLRQDRLDQFGQEAAYYKDNKMQGARTDFVLVTNEMDVARLRDVLSPPAGGGGFHFDRIYHVNRDLLEATHEDKFAPLAVYKTDGRLLSISDLLTHVEAQLGGG
jgi:hypothetical protein